MDFRVNAAGVGVTTAVDFTLLDLGSFVPSGVGVKVGFALRVFFPSGVGDAFARFFSCLAVKVGVPVGLAFFFALAFPTVADFSGAWMGVGVGETWHKAEPVKVNRRMARVMRFIGIQLNPRKPHKATNQHRVRS